MKVILYSTIGCHLCDQAKTLLWPVLLQYRCRLVEVDIADDDELIRRYGEKIPVLKSPESQRELNWPFDELLASDYLAETLGL